MNKLYVLPIIFTITLNAEIVKQYENGSTYPLVEKNIVEIFKSYIKNNKSEIEKKLKAYQKKAKENIKNYKPSGLKIILPKAKKDKVFYPNVEYTTKQDIKDNQGKILYKKGFKFNPLHYITLTNRYVFIDYDDRKQVKWLKDKKFDKDISTKIVITNGKVFDAIEEFKREVFYAEDILIKKFELQAVPSLVEQEQDRIKVSQFKIKEKQ